MSDKEFKRFSTEDPAHADVLNEKVVEPGEALRQAFNQHKTEVEAEIQKTKDDFAAHLADNAPNARGNQIYHVEVVSSSVSESPDAGRIIFDTSQGKFFGGNGTEWV